MCIYIWVCIYIYVCVFKHMHIHVKMKYMHHKKCEQTPHKSYYNPHCLLEAACSLVYRTSFRFDQTPGTCDSQ